MTCWTPATEGSCGECYMFSTQQSCLMTKCIVARVWRKCLPRWTGEDGLWSGIPCDTGAPPTRRWRCTRKLPKARKDEGGSLRTTSRRPSRKTWHRKTAQRRTPRTGHSGGRPKKKSHKDPAVAERAKGRKIPTSCTNSLYFSLLFRKFYFYFCKNHNLSLNPMN